MLMQRLTQHALLPLRRATWARCAPQPPPAGSAATATVTAAASASVSAATTISSRSALPFSLCQSVSRRAFSTSPQSLFRASQNKMVVKVLNNQADFNAALHPDLSTYNSGLVVLDCFAEWCGPCKVIAPKVSSYSDTYTNVAFYKIDVDAVPDVAAELGVRAMPTFFFFKNGQKVDEVVGAAPPAIEAAIKKHLA